MKYLSFYKFILFFFISIISFNTNAQNSDENCFISKSNIFHPAKSSVFESRIGFSKFIDNKNLKLDIGASADIIRFNDEFFKYSFGIDFFTFSNLRTESDFKFPVDAIDYFFGINFNFKRNLNNGKNISARVRLSHISSHLEDGHIYSGKDSIFTPVVYSREFADLSLVYDINYNKNFLVRNMIGLQILFHSIPGEFGIFSFHYCPEISYFPYNNFGLTFSDEIKLLKVLNETNLNNNLILNIKFGNYFSRGINLYFSFYSGYDYKGQYFGNKINLKSIGINIDI